VVPAANSEQFERFCELNKGTCPLLYHSKPGEVTAASLAIDTDIRTLLSSYFVLKNGQQDSRAADLKQFPWSDMVSFYIRSISSHIEQELLASGIPVQSTEQKRAVSQYKTNIQCTGVPPFNCPLVVCMHPIPQQLLERTVAVTLRLGGLYGAPIHIGDPSVIGIRDINRPDYGDPSDMDGCVPMFWPSSLTSHLAIKSAEMPLAFTDNTDRLVGCDAIVEDFLDKHPFANTDAKPRVVTIKESPFAASLLSEEAMTKIRYLETEIQEDIGKRGIANLHIPDELLKAALVLSHGSSVGIHFGFPCNTNEEFPDETDGPLGAIVLGKALKALGKEVTFIASYYHVEFVQELVRTFLENNVSVVEFTPERTHGSGGVKTAANKLLFNDAAHQISPKFDVVVAIEAVSRSEDGRYMTMKARDLSHICKVSPVDEVFIQAYESGKITTIGIGDGGNEIGMGKVHQQVIEHIQNGRNIASTVATDYLVTAGVSNWGGSALVAALGVLSQCPVHSRYARRGAGTDGISISKEDVLMTVEMEEEILKCIVQLGVCDGISQRREMSVDGQPFHPVHKDKLQKLFTLAASP